MLLRPEEIPNCLAIICPCDLTRGLKYCERYESKTTPHADTPDNPGGS